MADDPNTERDDDVAAIEGGPDDAPETTDREVDTVGPDEPGHGMNRPHRSVRESTRKLFQVAAAELKKQVEEEDEFAIQVEGGDDDTDSGTPTSTDAAASTASTTAAGTATAASTSPSQPSAAAPPSVAVPALSPEADKAKQTLELREKALGEREAALVKREQAADTRDKARERYLEKPADTIRDLIKDWTAAESDDDVREEIADLITELSAGVLGLSVSPEVKLRADSRKAIRTVRAYKADEVKREAARAKEQEKHLESQRDETGLRVLSNVLPQAKDDKGTHKFPYLMSEDNPHAIVWDVIKTQFAREGVQPDWEAAAKLADDYFRDQARRFYDKRRHLLTPTEANTAPSAATAQHQGGRPSHRPSELTNRTTTPVPPQPNATEEVHGEERRRRSLTKLKGIVTNGARQT